MEAAANDAILSVADLMITAALTAPKASGQDKIVAVCISGEDKDILSQYMEKVGEAHGEEFITRDADNLRSCPCVVVIGMKSAPLGLGENCHLCGFADCADMIKSGGNCALNLTDLGIAIGSAVSVAADHRIDNRVMYSVGKGALEMGIFANDVDDIKICYGIPLYAGPKSIFFDRGPGAILR